MTGWDNFFVAEAGASAALTGLVFVGLSINLKTIMRFPQLPRRAFEALGILMTVLLLACTLLVPDQRPILIAAEVTGIGLLGWGSVTISGLRGWREVEAEYRSQSRLSIFYTQAATLPLVIGGITMLADPASVGHGGMAWVVTGTLLCFVVALTNAWVLAIEINR